MQSRSFVKHLPSAAGELGNCAESFMVMIGFLIGFIIIFLLGFMVSFLLGSTVSCGDSVTQYSKPNFKLPHKIYLSAFQLSEYLLKLQREDSKLLPSDFLPL